jgi:hypothetical protein
MIVLIPSKIGVTTCLIVDATSLMVLPKPSPSVRLNAAVNAWIAGKAF